MKLKYDCVAVSRKDGDITNLSAKLEGEQNLVAQLQKKIKELQVNDQQSQPVPSALLNGWPFKTGLNFKFTR